jgi:hypothetical protein
MQKYDDLPKMFNDGLLQHSDILIFWGKRGSGKSSLKAMFEVLFMQPRNAKQDLKLCKSLCEELNMAGLNLHPPQDHLVFVNTFTKSVGPHLKRNYAYTFRSLDFGLPNETHPTGLLCPVGKYSFDEDQDLFDSHMGSLATFVSKAIELSRQPELFLMMAVQRPMRIPQDIRDLATFIECESKESFYNKYGRLERTEWTCNIIYNGSNLSKYLESRDVALIDKKVKFVFNGNIYKCYDSRYFLPMFYTGFDNQDFVLEKCQEVDFSPKGFNDFHHNHPIDIPETYRGKKKKGGNDK